MQLFGSLRWDGAQDCFMGLRGEDLIRLSVEGPSLEDVDARESVASWFSQGQRSRKLNYRSWPSEGHVTAMEDSP